MLRNTIWTFFTSESGVVSQRAGLSFGWVVVMLMGILVLQSPQPASADYCYGIPEGQCGWVTVDDCYPNPSYIQEEWCHSPSVGCYNTGAVRSCCPGVGCINGCRDCGCDCD